MCLSQPDEGSIRTPFWRPVLVAAGAGLVLEAGPGDFEAEFTDGEGHCVIRRKPAGDSEANRPPIPTEVGHPFRSDPAPLLRPV